MIKEERQMQEIITKHRYCDECGVKLRRSAYSVLRCETCGKDLCYKCIGHEDPNSGDREVFCRKCWEIGGPYRFKIEQMEDEMERLEIEWRNMCKGNQ